MNAKFGRETMPQRSRTARKLSANRRALTGVLGKVRERIKQSLSKDQSVSHRIDHLDRVRRNAIRIAEQLRGVDIEILSLAALLHDVNQPYNNKEKHVELSVTTAKQ